MGDENVQDQSQPEELTDEQSDATFEARLQGADVGDGNSESDDAQPSGKTEGREGAQEGAETPEDNLDDLKKERDALKKELARVREDKRGGRERIEKLESELQEVRQKIEKPKENPLDTWDLKTTYQQARAWRAKVDQAKEAGDLETVKVAEHNLAMIEDAIPDKIEQAQDSRGKTHDSERQIENSVNSVTDLTLDKFPDLENPKSEIFEQAEEEINDPKFAALNQSLGKTLASHFAFYRMILKNPDILKGKVSKENVLKNVNKSLTKASMSPGAKNAAVPRVSMSDEDGDKVFDELLRGQRTSI